jgi:hypothetical protein
LDIAVLAGLMGTVDQIQDIAWRSPFHAEIILVGPRRLNYYPQTAGNAYAGGGINASFAIALFRS